MRYLFSAPATDRLDWILDGDGSVQVVTCTVERAAPYRITATRTMALIPSVLIPKLPADFTDYPEPAARGAAARLIVFERRRAEFPPWTGQVLTVDAVQPLSRNLATVLTYVTG